MKVWGKNLPSWRPLTWVIIVIQVLFVLWIISAMNSASGNCADETTQSGLEACQAGTAIGAGIGFMFILFLWAMVDVILGVTWLVTNKNKRTCPACGQTVKKGLTVCPSCQFNFAAAAGGGFAGPTLPPGQFPPPQYPPPPPPMQY